MAVRHDALVEKLNLNTVLGVKQQLGIDPLTILGERPEAFAWPRLTGARYYALPTPPSCIRHWFIVSGRMTGWVACGCREMVTHQAAPASPTLTSTALEILRRSPRPHDDTPRDEDQDGDAVGYALNPTLMHEHGDHGVDEREHYEQAKKLRLGHAHSQMNA
jgi:hypothetical protein